eukprot:SAG31_NODE_4704_length_3021_cov_4.117043_1_plen_78_part_00
MEFVNSIFISKWHFAKHFAEHFAKRLSWRTKSAGAHNPPDDPSSAGAIHPRSIPDDPSSNNRYDANRPAGADACAHY